MPNNCPVCGNRDRVYDHGRDPVYGEFVLCELHGIQVCERPPKPAQHQGFSRQRAYPRMEYLDGGMMK